MSLVFFRLSTHTVHACRGPQYEFNARCALCFVIDCHIKSNRRSAFPYSLEFRRRRAVETFPKLKSLFNFLGLCVFVRDAPASVDAPNFRQCERERASVFPIGFIGNTCRNNATGMNNYWQNMCVQRGCVHNIISWWQKQRTIFIYEQCVYVCLGVYN